MRFLLQISFLVTLFHVNAAPALERSSIVRRQNQTNIITRPVEVTQVTQTETPVGVIVQTCNIKLTPVTSPNGQTAVREDKVCRVEVQNGFQRGGNNNRINFSSTTTTTVTSTTTVRATATPPPPPSLTITPPFAPAPPTIAPPPPAVTPPPATPPARGPVANPVEVGVIGTNAPPPLLAQPTPTIAGPQLPAFAGNPGVGVVGPSVATGIPDVNATAAAAQGTGFVIPGQRLQVLPIGLGVFAGISVIALIVVGLVTYERTKYRKTFRQRKLAETAAPMGYGGMAER